MIHAVDSMKLLKEINKQAAKHDRVIDCLLQFHIAEEDTKFGMNFNEVQDLLESDEFIELRNINIAGLMGMATFTDNTEQIREEFRNLENYFQIIKSHYFKFNDGFQHISMGMSGDYPIAIEEGSTMVRVGSAIFGARN
jgi:pyridoxal phosphate enzyme (YggS family)